MVIFAVNIKPIKAACLITSVSRLSTYISYHTPEGGKSESVQKTLRSGY